jgi:hypothetical protein
MTPAVTLRPVDDLAASRRQAERLCFDVGVEPLLDQDADISRCRIGDADVEFLEIAAQIR